MGGAGVAGIELEEEEQEGQHSSLFVCTSQLAIDQSTLVSGCSSSPKTIFDNQLSKERKKIFRFF